MKNVLIRGPLLSKSGYGVHCRQVYRYLSSQKDIDLSVEVLPWGITPWYLNREDLGGLVGEIMEKTSASKKIYDVSVQVQLPNEWDPSLAKKNIGITAAIETTHANPLWTSVHCEKMDLVIVPSEHSKKSLTNTGIATTTPIVVVPESYFEELEKPADKIELNLETKFNFLTVGVLTGMTPETDRKNLLYLIKWFVEEFKDNKDVGLIIKTNQGRDTTIDRKNTQQLLSNVLREIGHKGFPKVYMLHGAMNRSEMTSLYKHKDVKAFVSCTRGEGFGLPFLEASIAGLPIIATNWSAHKEFLDKGKWISLNYSLNEVHETRVDGSIFIKGTQWATVDEADFKKKITTFYNKPELPVKWAKTLSETLSKEYSFDAIHSKYNDAIGELLR